MADFGVYIHWPFCRHKCPYCDFNSHVSSQVDHGEWAEAYLLEIDRVAKELGPRVLQSVYFGGGTPSLMAPETVDAILSRLRGAFAPANDIEVTLEANPTSVEAGKLAAFRDAGVNRVSLGLQALNDPDLKRLGRMHSAAEGVAAYDTARGLFDRVSFDLIYARQDQSAGAWRSELTEALAMAPDHLSLYQLTIEPGTVFGARHATGHLRGLPGEDLSVVQFELTQTLCMAAGLPAYEVSNHARPGQESRHNLIYWTGAEYAGIGPGAHGRIHIGDTRFATETPLAPAKWLRAALAGNGETLRTALSAEDQADEYLMMGLRLSEGIDLARWGGQGHEPLIELGHLVLEGGRLKTTPSGRLILNAIVTELLSG